MVTMDTRVINKKSGMRNRNLTWLALVFVIIVLVNFISSHLFFRLDLTSEKRYTLSAASRSLLKNLKDVLFIKIYLHGEFPPGFIRLEKATRELLDEMRVYAGENIQYEFIDPSASDDVQQRNELYRQLARKGIVPTNLRETGTGSTSEKIIFPGALIVSGSREQPVQLLKDHLGASPEAMLNNSILNLEYEFSNAFRKITTPMPESIGFVQGHGELEQKYVADIMESLAGSYVVSPVTINSRLKALNGFKTVIIAKPDSAFDEKDKFILDQFIMKGGRVLWLIDQVKAEMDSLASANEALAVSNNLNLDDMLFRYGARINYNLVQDLMAAPVPVVTGNIGNKPQQSLLPWYYFPVVIPASVHPVVKNLNAVRFQFVSTIDTVGAPSIRKTALLTTSPYTRVLNAPVRITLELMRSEPDIKSYNHKEQILALLLEGNFQSLFTNRIPPEIEESDEIGFSENGKPSRMVVISDGDVIRNDYRKSTAQAFPLGFDRYTGETYGNKNFLLNVIDYLSDDSGLISIRSKELKLRIFDKAKLASGKRMWQIICTAGPLLLVIAFGIIKYYLRRKKFLSPS